MVTGRKEDSNERETSSWESFVVLGSGGQSDCVGQGEGASGKGKIEEVGKSGDDGCCRVWEELRGWDAKPWGKGPVYDKVLWCSGSETTLDGILARLSFY